MNVAYIGTCIKFTLHVAFCLSRGDYHGANLKKLCGMDVHERKVTYALLTDPLINLRIRDQNILNYDFGSRRNNNNG